MKISIITATFNSSATIKQTIESVLGQDHPDLEYIIIDGQSKDNTVEIIKSFGNKIIYISEPDNGIYDALNKGITLATGEVVGTIGSDDFYPNSQIISQISSAFEQHKTDAIYGDIQFVNPGKEDKIVRIWRGGNYNIANWQKGWMPPHPTFFIKKQSIETHGNFVTNLVCAGDYELMLRLLYKNKVSAAYQALMVVTMRNGGTSTASFKHRWRANQEDRMAWKMNGLKPKWYTLLMKPISKISQLFV